MIWIFMDLDIFPISLGMGLDKEDDPIGIAEGFCFQQQPRAGNSTVGPLIDGHFILLRLYPGRVFHAPCAYPSVEHPVRRRD